MKKLLLLLWAITPFMFLSKVNAQLSFTPHFGLNQSKVAWYGTKVDSFYNYLRTPTLGLTTKYNFSKKWAAELGVQYSEKGSDENDKTVAFKAQYIDFIPAVEYSPSRFLSFYSGFNVGVRKDNYYRFNGKWNKSPVVLIDDFYNKVDFGGLIGLRLKMKNLTLGVHYNHSIIPTTDGIQLTDDDGIPYKTVGEYQQNFQLTLGYQINVKKK